MTTEEPKRRFRGRFFTGLLSGGLIGLLLTGAFTLFSGNAYGGPWGHGGGRCGFGHPRSGDASTAADRAGIFADWILRRIDASQEPRDQVKTVVQDARGWSRLRAGSSD